jgi:hypothetical protein
MGGTKVCCKVIGLPTNRTVLSSALACSSSVLFFGLIFRPESRLNCASTLVSEVGEYSGPVKDAALCPRQSLLRFLELAFGVAHSTTPDSVELWIRGHAEFQN